MFIFSLLFANAFIMGGGKVFATPASLGNGVTWELDGTTLTIGYEGSGSGVMPTYSSNSDASRPWYSDRASITNIVVEEGITVIGAYAFHGCTAATTVSLPSTLDSIGYYVFYSLTTSCATTFHGTIDKWCSVGLKDSYSNPFYRGDGKFRTDAGIITTLTIPQGVTQIKPYVFRGTTITKLTIPNTVTRIDQYAFGYCSSLATLNFEATSSVDSIATYAFASTALTSLTIPSSVRIIEERAFSSCASLTTIDFNNATKLKRIGNYAFYGTTALTTLSLRGATSLTTIGTSAFALGSSGNTNAKSYLYLPTSLRTIGANAFAYRKGLEGIVIMNTNTTDANLTKSASTSFSNVPTSIPVYVNSSTLATTYGSLTGWSSFTNFTYTNEVTFNCGTPTASALVAHLNIRTGALTFTGSGDMKDYTSTKADWRLDVYKSVLKSVTISKMSRIGAYAFYQCSNLTGSVSIPSTVVSIGNRAFYGCSGLTGLSFSSATALTTIDTYAFHGCTNIASDIVFPSTLTTLGTYSFQNCSALTGITIPSSLGTISSNAFSGCSSVTTLDLQGATSLTTIGASAFSGMRNVTGYIFIPSTVTSLGSSAMSNMTSITGIIATPTSPPTATTTYTFNYIDKTIPVVVQNSTAATNYKAANGWKEFSNYQYSIAGQCGDALYWSLNPFTGVMSITGSGEMYNYNTSDNKAPWYGVRKKITTVSISKDAESIGEYAFDGCSNITSFTFNYDAGTNHNSLVSIGQYAFRNCSSATFTNLWGNWSANLTSVGKGAFNTCTQLTSVTIPENITFMDDVVFTGCSGLTTVVWNATNYTGTNISNLYNPFYSNRSTITSFTFGSNVESIPAYLCYNMSHLTGTLTIGNNILSIGDNAFRGCSGYTALTFEAGCQLTSIPNYAFYQCTNLTLSSNYFPSTITSIGERAFYECTHITNVNFGTSSYVTSIGEYAFKGCTGITSITLGTNSRLTSIGSYAFNGCTGITTSGITLPKNLATLGTYAFDGCTGLRGALTINCPSLTAIGNNAFCNCSSFTKLDLTGATSLETIGNSAFSGCTSIAGEIYIPSTVTSIGTKAFYNCSAVTSMYVEPTSVPTATTNASTGTFQGMTNTIPVRVPESMVSAYQSAAGWEYFTNIQAYAAGQCGDNLYWRVNYDKRRLEITGSGAMYDYNNTTNLAPWRSHTSYWTSISFPAEMTTFGQYSFYGCTNLSGSISFLAGIEQIRADAFRGCTGITGLTFSSATSLTTIGSHAFYGCSHSSFTTLTLPNSLTTIQGNAFGLCTSLTTVTIPRNVTTMTCSNSENTFYSCSNITTVNWNAIACNDFTSTGGQYGVSYHTPWGLSKSNITQFKIGSDVRIIPKYLCQALTSITSISLGDSIREIHEGAFMGCTSLATVTLPANITTLSNSAFNGCSAMTRLDMSQANKLTSIGINVFEGCSNVDGLIYVPASVTSIGSGAFKDFSKVDTIIASRDLPPTALSATFTNMVKSIPLIVPDDDAITAYSEAIGWKEFTNIKTHSISGKCGDDLYWSLNPASGELDITGTGAMYDFTMDGSSWFAHRAFIKRVNVEDGATYIGNNAFRNCKSMQYIGLPASITSMGSSIFGTGTGQLKDYSYAGTLEEWLAIDFSGHTGNPTYATRSKPNIEGSYVTEIVIPEGYTTVKPYVFTYCQGLKTLSLPGTLTSLQSGCFYYCDGLTDIWCYAETPPTLPATNAGIFSTNLIKTATLHVLCDDAVDAYRAYSSYSDHWGRFTTIEAIRPWCDELVVEDDATLSEEISDGFEGNVIVQSGATLEMDDLGAISVAIHDLIIEPEGRIELASDATYDIDNLIMQRSGDSSDDKVATAEIKGSLTADNLIMDFELDDTRWFTISLPQTVAANAVTYADDGTALVPDVNYYALSFDGAQRAEYSTVENNWEWVTSGDLNAGEGYLIGLPDGAGTKTLRFTMPGYTYAETSNKTIAVSEYASDKPIDAGWNMVGNPFLQNYHHTTTAMTVGDKTLTAVVTLDFDGARIEYNEELVADAVLPPFSAMFVQAPTTGSLVFTAASARKNIRARYPYNSEPQFLSITLSGNGGEDITRIMTGEYSNEYTIGADMVKWFNEGYTLQTAPTLYTLKSDYKQAINARSAEMLEAIPVGYHATQEGTYTFTLGNDEAEAFEHVLLHDSELEITTDLKLADYAFTSAAGTTDNRFTLTATLANEQVVTGVDIVNSQKSKVESVQKILRDGQLYILRGDKTYTVIGQTVE